MVSEDTLHRTALVFASIMTFHGIVDGDIYEAAIPPVYGLGCLLIGKTLSSIEIADLGTEFILASLFPAPGALVGKTIINLGEESAESKSAAWIVGPLITYGFMNIAAEWAIQRLVFPIR